MVFKSILILAALAQLLAAGLALRINFRYRIYSAWFLLSAAASVGAILRLTTLSEVWTQTPTLFEDRNLWLSTVAALLASILLLGGMALIEPFFVRISEAEKSLRQEHRELTTIVRATEEELKLAQRIQRRLLPANAVELPGLDIAGVSQAAEWTSGDYFDYLPLRSGNTALVIADVCGHGIGPALLMSSTRASLRGLAPTLEDVGELLTHGNRAVVDCVSPSEFVTIFAALYDSADRTLHYAGAGHVAFYLRSDGSSQLLEADAPPLGILPELTVPTRKLTAVETGEILILVTDGILESRNAQDEMFGEARLLSTVHELRLQPAARIVQGLILAATEFSGQREQQDDITVVIMKVI
ncbi:MAG: serine/threonine-protein phosphatase [Planctomycetales bacterium]|nr:serine/threonine-protein phosphatase [Planctomycetales bacterium]